MKRTMAVMACACVLALSGCKKKGGDAEDPIPVDNSPVVHSDISNRAPKGCGSGFWSVHYGDAYKTLRQAEEYKPGLRDYYVSELSDRHNEYLDAAISPKEREEWFTSHKTDEKDRQCMTGIFDALQEAAKRTLPKFKPRGYVHHDSDEEDLITKAVKAEFPDAEVLAVGVASPSWEIEKLGNGTPKQRYKYGMAWVKSPSFDDGFCRIAYTNILQDYSGGGTYAESHALYLNAAPSGCK